jgi:hypothetical protein
VITNPLPGVAQPLEQFSCQCARGTESLFESQRSILYAVAACSPDNPPTVQWRSR